MQLEQKGISIEDQSLELDVSPYSLFIGSIRSPVTKDKYLQRMRYFLDYLNIRQKDVEERFLFVEERFLFLQKGKLEKLDQDIIVFDDTVDCLFMEELDIVLILIL